MKYKNGDKVRVTSRTVSRAMTRSAIDLGAFNSWVPSMDSFRGKECIVQSVSRTEGYLLTTAGVENSFWFLAEWLEPVDGSLSKQTKRDRLYMDIAERVAQESYARRSKVGSILVRDDHILAQGWNGMPTGADNNCEDETTEEKTVQVKPSPLLDSTLGGIQENPDLSLYLSNGWSILSASGTEITLNKTSLVTKPDVLHAETNCLMKLMKTGITSVGATLYVTLAPCLDCAKLIKQAGITRVVYKENYRCTKGIDFLKEYSVIVEQINLGE